MARYKLVKISCLCVAGCVVQPDANGEAEISKETTDSPDFARLLGELRDGAAIEYVGETDEGEKTEKITKKKSKSDEKEAA